MPHLSQVNGPFHRLVSQSASILKRDVIEALQCLKCMYQSNLIFRDVTTASEEVKDMEQDPLLDVDGDTDVMDWDDIVVESEADT